VAPAHAAVPPGFWGTMVDGPLTEPGADLDGELRLMRSSGVGTVRVAFDWRVAEPVEGAPTRFAETDRLVGAAARRGLGVLPVVLWAPEWARRDPGQQASPPKPRPYAAFVAKLARRYGPRGSFWRGRRAQPIRDWQIWNEPTVSNFWTIQPFQHDYVELLRRTRRSVRRVDRGARVVTAGLVYESWKALEKLYRAGARGHFDVLALHPFTERPRDSLRIVELNRRVMRRWDDPKRPVYLTEVSWPSSRDKIGERYGYETDESGQARKIRQAFPLIAGARRRLRIERAYWYTWLTRETDPAYPFDYAGLRKLRDGRAVSKPALRAFRETIAKLRR
jgi:hypothetical protein